MRARQAEKTVQRVYSTQTRCSAQRHASARNPGTQAARARRQATCKRCAARRQATTSTSGGGDARRPTVARRVLVVRAAARGHQMPPTREIVRERALVAAPSLVDEVVLIIRGADAAFGRAGDGSVSLGMIQARLVAKGGPLYTYSIIQDGLRAGVASRVLESCDEGTRFRVTGGTHCASKGS